MSTTSSSVLLFIVAGPLFLSRGALGFVSFPKSLSSFAKSFPAAFDWGRASVEEDAEDDARAALAATTEETPTFAVQLMKQDVPVIRNGKVVAQKTAFFGEVHVGSPMQTFTVVFDTGSGHLILPSLSCESETCTKHRRFSSKDSTSAVEVEHNGTPIPADADATARDQVAITFGTGKVVGEFVQDKACLGTSGLFCADLRVVLATSMSDEPFAAFNFDGVLGLGLMALTLRDEFSFFGQMAAQHPTMQPRFGFFLGHGESAGDESAITFGGHDKRQVDSELRWAPLAMQELGYWQVQIKSVRIGDTVLDDCADGTCRAILDTGTSLIGVPKQSAQSLHRQLARAVPDEQLAAVASSGDDIDCRKLPGQDVHFELLDGLIISLGVEDYSRRSPIVVTVPAAAPKEGEEEKEKQEPVTRTFCRAALLPVDMKAPLGPKVFIWGEPVLRKYYTMYDWGAKQVGFAMANHPSATTEQGDAAVV